MAHKDPEARRVYRRKYYRKNRKKIIARVKKWKREDDKRAQDYNKEYYQKNRRKLLEHNKQYVQDNREASRARGRRRHNKKRAYILQYKLTHPCARCGEDDPRCLDFHHLDPSEKFRCISKMLSWSLERIKEEIEKCEVLCANCHRKETLPEEMALISHYTK